MALDDTQITETGILTDADLAPVLRAVPSYAAEWADERDYLDAQALANPGVAWFFFSGLAYHLGARAAAGDFTEFTPMFTALDDLYRKASDADNIDTVLTTGFLESLIYSMRDRGVAASLLTPHVTGAEAHAGWDAAYEYTHRGEVP